jgi:hypothetical protein
MKRLIIKESQYETIQKYLNETAARSYIFDWDDNILFMPTKIQMKKDGEMIDVSTEEFAQVRTNPDYEWGDWSFDDFRKTESFLRDAEIAIREKKFAPSFDKFKEALIYGNPFAINTARGHKPEALKQGVKMFIEMVFTDEEKQTMVNSIRKEITHQLPGYRQMKMGSLSNEQIIDVYLNEMGEYYPVSSEEFGEKFGLDVTGGAANPEHAKKVAIEHFTKKVLTNVKKLVDSGYYKKVSIGFSDDDKRNVQASEEFLQNELSQMYPNLHFVVYDTSEGGKNKLVIEKE